MVFLHDPQTAGLLAARGRGGSRWVWRCHIDTSTASSDVWAFLLPLLEPFDAAVFTMREFVPTRFPLARVEVIPPAIDPLSPKNFELPKEAAAEILGWFGIAADRPLITQVSRFDPWKDPLGVVEAYRLARADFPGLQLALVGSMALDDPEGGRVYREILKQTRGDPAIHVLTNLTGISSIEVNAFQRLSTIVVQKSIREGFGLVVAEALWKGTPVVAGRAGGIPLQIGDDGGFLVDDTAECARTLVRLLRDPALGVASAARGRECIRRHYLIPRLVRDELRLIASLVQGRAPSLVEGADPVCGMAGSPAITASQAGRTYQFCSRTCQQRFEWNPQRYVRATS